MLCMNTRAPKQHTPCPPKKHTSGGRSYMNTRPALASSMPGMAWGTHVTAGGEGEGVGDM